jgi:diguanylate cyclase (GGDEF)-like protein
METLAAFRPELVLMDLNMPEFSGAELAGVIRQHDEWVGLPIVYLSAEADLDEQIKAMSQGTDDFLTKPISDAHLIAAVQVRAARSRQLNDLMARDSLTGLYKHARIKEELDIETARSRRNGTSFSVAMVDIDHFKSINDTYGHVTGDRVIKALAHLLKQRLRITDSIGRYGGEEFLVILPDSSANEAKALMEDIRHRFGSLCFRHDGREFAVTFSAGVAGADVFTDADQLLEAADSALYAAKHRGRNQVVLNLQDDGILTGECI